MSPPPDGPAPGPTAPGFRLVEEAGGREHETRFDADQPQVLMGRGNCDFIPAGDTAGVGRQHALIRPAAAGGFELCDLHSKNKSYVNGVPVPPERPAPLRHGDVVHLGRNRMVFRLERPARPQPPPEPVPEEDWPEATMSLSVKQMAEESGGGFGSGGASGMLRNVAVDSSTRGGAIGLDLFRDIGSALNHGGSMKEVLGTLKRALSKHVPGGRAEILLTDESTGRLMTDPETGVPVGPDGKPVPVSRTLAERAVRNNEAVFVSDAGEEAGTQSIAVHSIRSALCVPLYDDRNDRVEGVVYADLRGPDGVMFGKPQLELISAAALFAAAAVRQARDRVRLQREEKARERLSRYASPRVVEMIVAGTQGGTVSASGSASASSVGEEAGDGMITEEREVSVMFADLVGFTAMSEKLSPATVLDRLNRIFTLLTGCVFAEDGTLDKFMGDGMLAFFGAPLPQEDHADRAVRTARAMHRAVAAFNAIPSGLAPVKMRVGINSGPVIAGDVGSRERKDYTVIGDTVNTASRLESSVAKPDWTVIGTGTYRLLTDKSPCEPLEPARVKGKAEPVPVWRVV